MKTKSLMISTAGALLMLAGAAQAQTAVTATTDLNVRAGPGSNYEVIGTIPSGGTATLNGCADNSKWCSVTVDGTEGWAYSDYLQGEFAGQQVVVTERPADSVAVTTFEQPQGNQGDEVAVTGAVGGAVAGALIGGPVGAAVGAAAGAAVGGAVGTTIPEPPQEVRTYVSSNAVEPVYLDGEVVVGAGLPESEQIVLREIPDYEYRYVNVNGQPVLVDPESRRIVYVFR